MAEKRTFLICVDSSLGFCPLGFLERRNKDAEQGSERRFSRELSVFRRCRAGQLHGHFNELPTTRKLGLQNSVPRQRRFRAQGIGERSNVPIASNVQNAEFLKVSARASALVGESASASR